MANQQHYHQDNNDSLLSDIKTSELTSFSSPPPPLPPFSSSSTNWVPFRERVDSVSTSKPPSQYEIQRRELISPPTSTSTPTNINTLKSISKSSVPVDLISNSSSITSFPYTQHSNNNNNNNNNKLNKMNETRENYREEEEEEENNRNDDNEDNNVTSITLNSAPHVVGVKKITQDGIEIHAGWNISSFEMKWQDEEEIDRTRINPYQEEVFLQLVSKFRGLSEMGIPRQKIADVFKNGREEITGNLTRKLFSAQRPTPQDIERRGIVPQGYFDQGHENAVRRQHRRLSSTMGNMNIMLKMRPNPKEVIRKGVMGVEELSHMYDVKDDSDEDVNNIHTHNHNHNHNQTPNGNTTTQDQNNNDYKSETGKNTSVTNDVFQRDGVWEVSLTRSLLFATIQEAFKMSCQQTTKTEQELLDTMQRITGEIKQLRDVLDSYGARNVSEQQEFQIRDRFQELQKKLLGVANRQQTLREKLQILQQVEGDLTNLQNDYNHKLGKLRRVEETILERLQKTKEAKNRAERIKNAECSHRNWAFVKLDFALKMTESHSKYLQNKIQKRASQNDDEKQLTQELEGNGKFAGELKEFLKSMKNLTERQQAVVDEYENSIENMESDLIRIRHEMSRVRQTTFAKIYELHKHVENADALDLGNRRISVANATEIDKERRHHATKIQRQISTLQSQLREVDFDSYSNRFDEMIDLQTIMSDYKLKAFFSVFVQSFCQTLIDVDLAYHQMQTQDASNTTTTTTILNNFYGVDNVLNTIESTISNTLQIKIKKTMRFIQILRNSILYEQINFVVSKLSGSKSNMAEAYSRLNPATMDIKIKIEHLSLIALWVGRKLSCNEHMQDEIDQTEKIQVTRLAEMRCRDIFKAVVNDTKIFNTTPHSIAETAKAILYNVWRIEVLGEE